MAFLPLTDNNGSIETVGAEATGIQLQLDTTTAGMIDDSARLRIPYRVRETTTFRLQIRSESEDPDNPVPLNSTDFTVVIHRARDAGDTTPPDVPTIAHIPSLSPWVATKGVVLDMDGHVDGNSPLRDVWELTLPRFMSITGAAHILRFSRSGGSEYLAIPLVEDDQIHVHFRDRVPITDANIFPNSYVSLDYALNYHAVRGNTDFSDITDVARKSALLVKATDYIERRFARLFTGTKSNKSGALSWPRTGGRYRDSGELIDHKIVPVGVLYACCEYARIAAAVGDLLTNRTERDVGGESSGVGSVQTNRSYDRRLRGTRIRQSSLVEDTTLPEYPNADLLMENLLKNAATGGGVSPISTGLDKPRRFNDNQFPTFPTGIISDYYGDL